MFDEFISFAPARLIGLASLFFLVAECSLRQLTIPRREVHQKGQITSRPVAICPVSQFLCSVRFFAWRHFPPLRRCLAQRLSPRDKLNHCDELAMNSAESRNEIATNSSSDAGRSRARRCN